VIALSVYLHTADVPTTRQWQQSFATLGIALLLNQVDDDALLPGYYALRMGVHASGFTLVRSMTADDWRAPLGVGDACVVLQPRDERRSSEVVCYAAAALLARHGGAVYSDPVEPALGLE
jgi:hypothetical protein